MVLEILQGIFFVIGCFVALFCAAYAVGFGYTLGQAKIHRVVELNLNNPKKEEKDGN